MEYKCTHCNKEYKTYQTLWNHNKKFHNTNFTESTNSKHCGKLKVSIKEIKCNKCFKVFKHKQSKSRHMKTCTVMEDKLKTMENEIIKLNKIIKKTQPQNITNNNNNGTIINNNIYINPPNKENCNLSVNEIKEIFNENISCILKYIDKRNFNPNMVENHSFCITNRDGKHLLTYDTDNNNIESKKKKFFLDTIITKAITEIDSLYKKNKDKFDKTNQKRIEDNISNLKHYNDKGSESKIYRELIDELNLQIYNKCGIILKTWIKILGIDALKKFKITSLIMNDDEVDLRDIFMVAEDQFDDNNVLSEQISDKPKLIPTLKKLVVSDDSDEEDDDVKELVYKGVSYILEDINLYEKKENGTKGELFGTYINGKIKKNKIKEIEV